MDAREQIDGQAPAPDFNHISTCFAGLEEEFRKIPGWAGLNNQQPLVEAIVALGRRQAREFEQLERRQARAFEQLERRMAASDHNNLARLANSSVTLGTTPLTPLHNVASNEPIPGFPASRDRLERLLGRDLDEILQSLGASIEGNVADKKVRLQLHIGLQHRRI